MQYVPRNRASSKRKEVTREEVDTLIDQWIIGRNGERNRAIVRRKLFDGISYEQLAEEFKISVRQAKNIVYSAEDKIFK